MYARKDSGKVIHPMKYVFHSVTGKQPVEDLGITDAHNHLWISNLGIPGVPVLDQEESILQDLRQFSDAGGKSQMDCQPAFTGRDAIKLRHLSTLTGVNIVACTGFHLSMYYADHDAVWGLSDHQAAEFFLSEIHQGLVESRHLANPVFPGFIKIALLETLDKSPRHLIDAAVHTSRTSEVGIVVHTEKGAAAVEVMRYISDQGISPSKIMICHIDKRPDLELHRDLASSGCYLEYDTFFRPKYHPERNVWYLIQEMVEAGLGNKIVLATDMADSQLWASLGRGPGLAGLTREIKPKLEDLISDPATIQKLLGGNAGDFLSLPAQESKL
jgi:phosphotriesterase-related protein